MKTRVQIEFPEGAPWRATATSEIEYATETYPLIVRGGKVIPPDTLTSIAGIVVTADSGLAARLQASGYLVRVSNPQAKWAAENLVAIGTKLTRDKHAQAKNRADALGLAMSGYIQQLIQADLDGRVDWHNSTKAGG